VADGVVLNPGSGGDTVAADDVGGAKYQWVKIATGGADVASLGASIKRIVSTGSSADETEVKASAGVVVGIVAVNVDTAASYLQLYNATTANVTVGTTTPVITFPLPASGGVAFSLPTGIIFSTAITAALTTTIGGSTSVTADKAVVTILYA
jgi:hypothetical protein